MYVLFCCRSNNPYHVRLRSTPEICLWYLIYDALRVESRVHHVTVLVRGWDALAIDQLFKIYMSHVYVCMCVCERIETMIEWMLTP